MPTHTKNPQDVDNFMLPLDNPVDHLG